MLLAEGAGMKFGMKAGKGKSSQLPFDVDAVLKNAAQPNRNGLTNAGRAFQKHAGRAGDTFSNIKFSGKTANKDAQKIIQEILMSPNKVTKTLEDGTCKVYDTITKRGFEVSRTGKFNGFRNLDLDSVT